MTAKNMPTLERLMKPSFIICGKCGGELHIIPFKRDLGKGKVTIETINICGKCSFGK